MAAVLSYQFLTHVNRNIRNRITIDNQKKMLFLLLLFFSLQKLIFPIRKRVFLILMKIVLFGKTVIRLVSVLGSSNRLYSNKIHELSV